MSKNENHRAENRNCYCQHKEINVNDITNMIVDMNFKIIHLQNEIIALKNDNTEFKEKSLSKSEKIRQNSAKELEPLRADVKSHRVIKAEKTKNDKRFSDRKLKSDDSNKQKLEAAVESRNTEGVSDFAKSNVELSDNSGTSETQKSNVRCQNRERNNTYCDCIPGNRVAPKIKKRISRGVQYDAPLKRKKKWSFLNCFRKPSSVEKDKSLGKKKVSLDKKVIEAADTSDDKKLKQDDNKFKKDEKKSKRDDNKSKKDEKISEQDDNKSKTDNNKSKKENDDESKRSVKSATNKRFMKKKNSQLIAKDKKHERSNKTNGILNFSEQTAQENITGANEAVYDDNVDKTTKQSSKSVGSNLKNEKEESNHMEKVRGKENRKSSSKEALTTVKQNGQESNQVLDDPVSKTDDDAEFKGNRSIFGLNNRLKRAKQYKSIKQNVNSVKKRLDSCITELSEIIGDVSHMFPKKTVSKEMEVKQQQNSIENN